MPAGIPVHTTISVALALAALIVRAISPNATVRSRLRLTIVLVVAILALDAALAWAAVAPEVRGTLVSVRRLLVALTIIHTIVLLALNPLRENRVSERFPTIVQDAIVIGFFLIVSTFVLDEKFMTTSAVGAVVVGFALQDTLGNMFSGLAIQVEKPFHVGHWISAGTWEGAVIEITWRATKLRTRNGNLVVVPNSELAKEAITNYSQPVAPTRLTLDVGVSYGAAPNTVRAVILDVLQSERLVLHAPPPQVHLVEFAGSSITYRARFWIADFAMDEIVMDRLRTGIYYAFARHQIEIPYPIQVEYSREERVEPEAERVDRVADLLARASLFDPLSGEERRLLAGLSRERLFGSGEAIVREASSGASAFVVSEGRVRVTIGPEHHEVATIGPGGYFGEMSLLTGDARTATVSAIDDTRVVEITADGFREIALRNPVVLETISVDVARRRAELAAARTAVSRQAAAPETASSLLDRVRRFLLGSSAETRASTRLGTP